MTALPVPSLIEARRDQMFPILETVEIERIRRFGVLRGYRTGEALAKAGSVSQGLTIILSGKVDVARHTQSGPGQPGACSMAAQIVLEESGEKYDAKKVDLTGGEQRTEAYFVAQD